MKGSRKTTEMIQAADTSPWSYGLDAWQRSVLFWDVMRQRGNNYLKNSEKTAPHALKFDYELIADGRKLKRPVNYALVRITPPAGVKTDPKKRPFVVVDPRAGHGPGIGGFKAESEIGVALKAGHPCYFIGFLPQPVPGQTIEDIMNAEAEFLERVIALHPDADGKPAVTGNCQAGWAVMMLAATRPELFGPLLIAGSPLSYWAGVHGENPMRYTGGLTGGSWITALMGDLGNGTFDGAHLVSNFEGLNPANTLWTKPYNLYAKIDTEPERYLDFEEWWSGHVLLNAEEMQFIADQLFIGNKLSAGEIVTTDGSRVDLRNIRSPIIVFCSKGDNITPPQQALGWILDLYKDIDDIRAHGQTIVYAIHETIGHLGIFVSGGVAKKEHDEFASNIDLIDALPPGLYEAVITPKDPNASGADLIAGDHLIRFEMRELADIRALGGNDAEDDRRFAAVARVSEINLGLYRMFLQPMVRAFANESLADWVRQHHPLRLQYSMFSDANPFMRAIAATAERVRNNRTPVAPDNPLLKAQEAASRRIEQSLERYGKARDRRREQMFHAIYGSPLLQALTGLKADDAPARQRSGNDAAHTAAVARRIADLKSRIHEGGPREAAIRALLYIRLPEEAADERGFAFLRRLRDTHGGNLPLADFKQLVREQALMILLDEERAIKAIPAMLSTGKDRVAAIHRELRHLIEAVGLTTKTSKARLSQIDAMFAAASKTDVLNINRPKKAAYAASQARPIRKTKNVKRLTA